jgi:hypothetical protein
MNNKIEKKVEPVLNKRGKVLGKQIILKAKNNYSLTLKTLDEVYKKMIESGISPEKINIRAELADGIKTLKSFSQIEDTLIYTMDDYYSSIPKDRMDKFEKMDYVIFQIRT